MAFEGFIADGLNGGSPIWDDRWESRDFPDACLMHGVAALIADRVETGQLCLPEAIAPRFREILDGHKVFELLHMEQLRRVAAALQNADIRFILLKGTALAHQVYAQPHLRSRGDTDILITERDRDTTETLLNELGYESTYESQMEAGSYQRSYTLVDNMDYRHTIDVHWHLSNRQLFALGFPWDEVIANTRKFAPLSGEAGTAFCLTPVYQVLHACMHRTCHMTSRQHAHALTSRGDRLIWLFDIHLICQNFSAAHWDELTRVAINKGISAIVIDTFNAVAEFFPIVVPDTSRSQLVSAGSSEISRRLLTRSRVRTLIVDLNCLPDWGSRFTLLREAAFPPAEQMLLLYQKHSSLWLPYLYLCRALGFRP